MFRLRLKKLILDYGLKKKTIFEAINSTAPTFKKKLEGELDFTDEEKQILRTKYKQLEIF